MSHRPQRILLTISDLVGRGAEREFVNLAQGLSRERFDPLLCFWRDRFDYPLPPDVPYEVLDKRRPWHVGRTIARLARVIDRWQPEIVFSQLSYVSLVTGTALRRARCRPRWVCRLVNDPRRDYRFPLSLWARRVLPLAAHVAGCSEGVSRAIVDHLRVPADRVSTLDNLVDVGRIEQLAGQSAAIHRPADTFVVAHLGQLVAQKNPALLLRAFARWPAGSTELWFLGEGPLRPSLEALASSLGVAPRVRWLGFQPNPYAWLREADCLALTSRHEGLPNALIEAQLLGLPVVATRCEFGPEELIDDGQTGLLVPLDNAEALAAALARLAGNPLWARQMGQQARDRARARFDLPHLLARYAAVLGGESAYKA